MKKRVKALRLVRVNGSQVGSVVHATFEAFRWLFRLPSARCQEGETPPDFPPTDPPPFSGIGLRQLSPLPIPSSYINQRCFKPPHTHSSMGIPMGSNIHAPTVASGPTSGGAPPLDLSKLGMVDLMQEKERIEEELSALSSVLGSHGVNMNTSLTTFDGFPRDDIDVAQNVMSHLEKGIHNHFANLQRAQTTAQSGTNGTSGSQPNVAGNNTSGLPFAKVNSVVPGSPADQAGLRVGDTVREFGSANWLNHERLSKVAEIVQQSEGRTVAVKVVRKDPSSSSSVDLSLQLVPRRDWGGRGLLGCHLVPL
ncbi:hypothetical protein ASPBRDRAFT_28537 [Aspergillus brasiliensis CBS 101740]|uniref:Probable 26S proteasome regulatory subunit p27 n=1 Tax=Aspergillus brasiliensis (strain CBS 101740 / IMI 381727 / IBT 21946) TaxID=767769 RepID=A0A1L9UNQ6_ASPBC|nr:hypothetical protein ASPBRDRAFT_28537 [Aspergillus brasiliensis CBS 101740]